MIGGFTASRNPCGSWRKRPTTSASSRRQSDGGPPIVQAWCNGSATGPLPWASRCPWEWSRSTTVALPLHYRRTAVEAREDDRLYRRVVSPKNMGRCPDSGVTSCPAWTCGQEATADAGAGSKRPLGQPEPRKQAGLPGGRGRAERRESLAWHWPGPWVWRLCFSCGGSSPPRKMRFEEQTLRMNQTTTSVFKRLLGRGAGGAVPGHNDNR